MVTRPSSVGSHQHDWGGGFGTGTVLGANLRWHAVIQGELVRRMKFGVAALALAATVSVSDTTHASSEVGTTTATSLPASRAMTAVEVGLQPQHMALSLDGAKLYVTNRVSNSVTVVDTTSGIVRTSIPVSFSPRAIVMAPDGRHVYVAHDFTNSITVIATASDTVTRSIPLSAPAWALALSPDGSTLYVTQGSTRTLLMIEAQTGLVKAQMPTGTDPASLTVSGDGKTVYLLDRPCGMNGCDPSTVAVIDTRTNTVTRELRIGEAGETAILSPDGTRLYVADLNDVWAFSTTNYDVLGKVRTFVTSSLTISTDGQVLYATRYDKPSLISIDTARFTIFDRRPVPTRPNDSALSPDGKTLYVLSQISGPVADPGPGVVTALDPPALVNIQATCAKVGSKNTTAVRCAGATVGVPAGMRLATTFRNPPSMEWRTVSEAMTPVVSADGRFTWTMATGKAKRITLYFSYGGTKSPLSAVDLR